MKLGEMTLREAGKKLIIPFVFLLAAAMLTPPDAISQITLAVIMAIIYGILRFIVSRFKSYEQTPESIKKLIIVMLCLLTVTITSTMFFLLCFCRANKSYYQLKVEYSQYLDSQQQTQTESQ